MVNESLLGASGGSWVAAGSHIPSHTHAHTALEHTYSVNAAAVGTITYARSFYQ